MNQGKSELLNSISALDYPEKEVVLTLDQFFEGNNNSGTVGVNIYPDQPEPKTFYSSFKKLLDDGITDKIFVRIADIEEPEDWFYSDTIYVIGSLSLKQLKEAVENLFYDEIYEGWMYGEPVNIEDYDRSKTVFSVWWD